MEIAFRVTDGAGCASLLIRRGAPPWHSTQLSATAGSARIMLSWLKQRIAGDRSSRLDDQLKQIEEEANAAPESLRGPLFNRAGDLCAAEGRTKRALVWYGRAVDVYLEAGFLGAAAAMCRKILRHSPEAVRAHCTLACLAAHGQHLREVKTEIRHLVEASQRTHTERLTIARLRLLADAVEDREVRQHIAAQLHALGDELGSERIAAALAAEVPRRAGDALPGDDEQWNKLVLAAALDPDELWKYA